MNSFNQDNIQYNKIKPKRTQMYANIIACADWCPCISFGWNQLYAWRCYTIYFQCKWICRLSEPLEQCLLFDK